MCWYIFFYDKKLIFYNALKYNTFYEKGKCVI